MSPASDVANITAAPTEATTQARRPNARPAEVPPLSASQRTGFCSSNCARRVEGMNVFAATAENGNLKGRLPAWRGLSCHLRGSVQPANTSINHAKQWEAAREIQYLPGPEKKVDSPPNAKAWYGLNDVKYQPAGNPSELKMPPKIGSTTTAVRIRTKVLLMALIDSRDQA